MEERVRQVLSESGKVQMSELKDYDIMDIEAMDDERLEKSELTTPIKIEIPGIGTIESADLYIKSEADKVIADLEESHKMEVGQLLIEIAELKKHAHRLYVMQARAGKELRHQKYKRCLAMSKICENKLGTVVKPAWWDRWHKRWLKLAEKFKEAK